VVVIVDDHHITAVMPVIVRSVPVTERTPTDIGIVGGPGNPGRRIVAARDPVPSKAQTPAPAPVMMGHVPKRIIGDPGQITMSRIPITVVIGPPTAFHIGNPHVNTQIVFVAPLAVAVQITTIRSDTRVHVTGIDRTVHRSTGIGPLLKPVGMEGVEGASP
jgi:hypothetical protein